jgi:transcriptional regulator with XRE-family HTH domain
MIGQTIKKLRSGKKISQREIADLLGVSRNTIVLLEKGKRDVTLDEAKKLSTIFGISVEELAGDEMPDINKYKQMILAYLQIAAGDGKLPKTKLAKLLYLADFTWFYHQLESMSGMSYRKIQYGPVPDVFFKALEDLEWDNLIKVESKAGKNYQAKLVSARPGGKKTKLDHLSKKELKLINKIYKKWADASTEDIVGFTHNQLPYKLAFENEIISYALIGQHDEQDLY